MMHADMVRERV